MDLFFDKFASIHIAGIHLHGHEMSLFVLHITDSCTGYGDTLDERAASSPAPRIGQSELDHTRSPSPSNSTLWLPKPPGRSAESKKLTGFRNENTPGTTRTDLEKHQPITRLVLKTSKMDHALESSPPIPPGSGHPVFHPTSATTGHHRRLRPETSHQRAVNMNRKMRIDSILHKKLVKLHSQVRRRKREQTSTSVYTAMSRIIDLPEDYDTEDEGAWGPGGLVPNRDEENDYGGEALRHKKVIDRALRRLARDDHGGRLRDLGYSLQGGQRLSGGNARTETLGTRRSRAQNKRLDGQESGQAEGSGDQGAHGGALDDLDLDLLGEGREGDRVEDESNEDSGMDETEDGDETCEEVMMDER